MNKKESNKRYLEEKKRLGFIYTSFFFKQHELFLLRRAIYLDREHLFKLVKAMVDNREKIIKEKNEKQDFVSAWKSLKWSNRLYDLCFFYAKENKKAHCLSGPFIF